MDFQYHKTLHDNPQLTSNPISRFWQKQQIKKQYAKEARNTANYSFNNTLLIAMQKPDASLIAGFSAWKNNFGRNVMKGQK